MDVENVNNKHFVLALKVKSVLDPCEDENEDIQDDEEVNLGEDFAHRMILPILIVRVNCTSPGDEWEYDSTSSYYLNRDNGYCYDPNSGFYYSETTGKWVTQEEALAYLGSSEDKKEPLKKPLAVSKSGTTADDTGTTNYQSGPPTGVVVQGLANPTRSVKGAPSSISVNKRKRVGEKPKHKVVSKEEAAALKTREAAKKRMEERETIAWPLQILLTASN